MHNGGRSSYASTPITTNRPLTFKLSPKVYEYRKGNILCFRCAEQYRSGHQCKKQQLNCLVGEAETQNMLREVVEDPSYPDMITEEEVEQEIQEDVFLNSLLGSNLGVNTILVGRSDVTAAFWKRVQSLHGTPNSIVTDRDRFFLSNFWQDFGHSITLQNNLSPSECWETERVNKCVENYLRCMNVSRLINQEHWVYATEWWYNTNFHTSLNSPHFEALYGFTPPHLPLGPLLETNVPAAVDTILKSQQMRF